MLRNLPSPAMGVALTALGFALGGSADETIAQVRREGRTACKQAAERLAGMLEPLIWQEATRRPVDISPGARPKRRRSRAEVLAEIAEANRMRAAARRPRRVE